MVQPRQPWPAQARGAGRGAYAGLKQRLGRINITHPHHHLARQQHLFHRRGSQPHGRSKGSQIKALAQRLHAQATQEFLGHGAVFGRGENDRTKATRVIQAQDTGAGVQVEVVMLARLASSGGESQTAGHAQMHEQYAAVQVQQEVFAPAAYGVHPLAHQAGSVTSQRPAQRLAQPDRHNQRAGNGGGEAQAGHFNFG